MRALPAFTCLHHPPEHRHKARNQWLSVRLIRQAFCLTRRGIETATLHHRDSRLLYNIAYSRVFWVELHSTRRMMSRGCSRVMSRVLVYILGCGSPQPMRGASDMHDWLPRQPPALTYLGDYRRMQRRSGGGADESPTVA